MNQNQSPQPNASTDPQKISDLLPQDELSLRLADRLKFLEDCGATFTQSIRIAETTSIERSDYYDKVAGICRAFQSQADINISRLVTFEAESFIEKLNKINFTSLKFRIRLEVFFNSQSVPCSFPHLGKTSMGYVSGSVFRVEWAINTADIRSDTFGYMVLNRCEINFPKGGDTK